VRFLRFLNSLIFESKYMLKTMFMVAKKSSYDYIVIIIMIIY